MRKLLVPLLMDIVQQPQSRKWRASSQQLKSVRKETDCVELLVQLYKTAAEGKYWPAGLQPSPAAVLVAGMQAYFKQEKKARLKSEIAGQRHLARLFSKVRSDMRQQLFAYLEQFRPGVDVREQLLALVRKRAYGCPMRLPLSARRHSPGGTVDSAEQLAEAASTVDETTRARRLKELSFQLKLEASYRLANVEALTFLCLAVKQFKPKYVAKDVSRGACPIALPAVNLVDDTPVPDFVWTDFVIYKEPAHLRDDRRVDELVSQYLVSCACTTNCCWLPKQSSTRHSSSSPPEHDTATVCEHGGAANYKKHRLAKNAPATFEECNRSCACPPACGNRVMQHGRTLPLVLFYHPTKRWCCMSLTAVARGTFVSEYTGECISRGEAQGLSGGDITYLFDLDSSEDRDASTPTPSDKFTVNALRCGNEARFFSHSHKPNLTVRTVVCDISDHKLGRIAFYAARDILPYEELTFDYKCQPPPPGTPGTQLCHCGEGECKTAPRWLY